MVSKYATVRTAPLEEPRPSAPTRARRPTATDWRGSPCPRKATTTPGGVPTDTISCGSTKDGRHGVASTWWDCGAPLPGSSDVPVASVRSRPTVGHIYTESSHLPARRDRLLQGRRAATTTTRPMLGAETRHRGSPSISPRPALEGASSMQTSVNVGRVRDARRRVRVARRCSPRVTYRVWLGLDDERPYVATTRFTVAEFRTPEFEVGGRQRPKRDYHLPARRRRHRDSTRASTSAAQSPTRASSGPRWRRRRRSASRAMRATRSRSTTTTGTELTDYRDPLRG